MDNLESYIFEDEKVKYQHMGEDIKQNRSEAILHYNKKIGDMVNDYKYHIQSFEMEDSDNILNDAIDKYKTEIMPLNKEIQGKLFNIISIIDDDDKKRLVKLVLNFEKYEIDYTQTEILSDKK